MARIEQISNFDNTLFLAPREGLVYPFDFGDWEEIRWGVFYSVYQSGSDMISGTTLNENVLSNSLSDQFYIGLTTGNNVFQSGRNFIGLFTTGGFEQAYDGSIGTNRTFAFGESSFNISNSSYGNGVFFGGSFSGEIYSFGSGTVFNKAVLSNWYGGNITANNIANPFNGSSDSGIAFLWRHSGCSFIGQKIRYTPSGYFMTTLAPEQRQTNPASQLYWDYVKNSQSYHDLDTIRRYVYSPEQQLNSTPTGCAIFAQPNQFNKFVFYFPTYNRTARIHSIFITKVS